MNRIFLIILLCFVGLTSNSQSYDAKDILFGSDLSSVYYVSPLEVDKSGNKFITGVYQGLFSIGGKSINAVERSIFLIKADNKDSVLWIKNISTYPIGSLMIGDLGLNSYNESLTIGFYFIDSILSNGIKYYASGTCDGYLAKLDKNGLFKFQKHIVCSDKVLFGNNSIAE